MGGSTGVVLAGAIATAGADAAGAGAWAKAAVNTLAPMHRVRTAARNDKAWSARIRTREAITAHCVASAHGPAPTIIAHAFQMEPARHRRRRHREGRPLPPDRGRNEGRAQAEQPRRPSRAGRDAS